MYSRISCLILLTLIVGCGSSKPAHPSCYPVTGKLTYNGQPTKGAVIQLWPVPVNREKWQERKPSAQVAQDGTFKIWTFEAGDGAPPGEYAVTLVWDSNGGDNPPGSDVFGGKYSNPDQPIAKVTVNTGPSEIPPIVLSGSAVKAPGGG